MSGRTSSVVRTIATSAVAALAVIAVLASVIGRWAERVVDDPSLTGAGVAAALADPQVVEEFSQWAADQAVELAIEWLSLEDSVPLPNSLTDRVRGRVELWAGEAIETQLSKDVIARVGQSLTTSVHTTLVYRIAPYRDANVRQSDEAIEVNLIPLVLQALGAVQNSGWLSGIELPDPAVVTSATDQRAQLSAAIGIPLPERFGLMTVQRSDRLDSISDVLALVDTAVGLTRRVATVAPFVALVAFAAAVALSRHRIRTVGALGAATALTMVAVVNVMSLVERLIQDTATTSTMGRAIELVLNELTAPLSTRLYTVGALAAIVCVCSLVGSRMLRSAPSALEAESA